MKLMAKVITGALATAAFGALQGCTDVDELTSELEADVIAAVKDDAYFAVPADVEGDAEDFAECVGAFTFQRGETGSLQDYVDGEITYADITYLVDDSVTQEQLDADLEQLTNDCWEDAGFEPIS